ncbi:P2X purinoceptor 7-like [Haemaphysalis longicornis]
MASSDSCGASSSTETDNEDIAKEFGLEFSNFSELERRTLLRWRRMGLRPYEDDPPATSPERSPAGSSPQLAVADDAPAAIPPRRQSTDWCQCGHCTVLANFEERECLCCRELGHVVTALSPAGCIMEHADFRTVCLNTAVLRVAYFELRARGYPMSDDIHKRYRYTAYRQFVRWLWGWLGEGNRLVLPSCVVAKIRHTFPTETPTGFRYPEYEQALAQA